MDDVHEKPNSEKEVSIRKINRLAKLNEIGLVSYIDS